MNRARLTASLLVIAFILPASAEAARLRFGGGKRTSDVHSNAGSSGVAVVPGISRSSRPATSATTATAPERVPFPPANATAPTLLRLTANDEPKAWCRGAMVVGGFCVVN